MIELMELRQLAQQINNQEAISLYNKIDKEIERLNKKIEQYENPEDMTLMFMWCNEKAKDEIERLKSIIKEVREYCKNDDNFQILDLYSQDIVDGIQEELLEILDKENK